LSFAPPSAPPRAAARHDAGAAARGHDRPPRRVAYSAADGTDVARLLADEWLVTNGLGGYAAGTVGGVLTRRYHGLLVAALPAPWGRT
jgi:hypothetical protein